MTAAVAENPSHLMPSDPPIALCIVGPTASGKSRLAVEVARRLGGEVLSIDSRQVYRRLDVGTAKPTREEKGDIPHHLLDLIEPDEIMNAHEFSMLARRALDEVRSRGKVPVLAGGSGFYLRAVERGLFELALDENDRDVITRALETRSTQDLYRELADVDPEARGRIHPNDRYRIRRALEVYHLTGTSLTEHQARTTVSSLRMLKVGLAIEPERLELRIADRAGRMIESGWIEETAALMEEGKSPENCPGLRSLGYPEVYRLLKGKLSRPDAVNAITIATRQYAKRQRTWFRSEEVRWERDPVAAPGRIGALWLSLQGDSS